MDWNRGHTIGRGSSATVSIATSCQSGELFAVKSVELSQSEFLQREQKFLSCLSSPQIVSYKGCDITRENSKFLYNIKMEYASNGTLLDAVQKLNGRLDESMIRYYTHQIVKGLEYLHSSGIVHCDIKGRNILMCESGAKISDLGCAKWVDPVATASDTDVSATMQIGGTPMFMAPEVARGEEQGFPADIWALGCTIIEMATGGSPWPNVNDPMSVLYQIAYSGKLPEFPDFLSHQVKDFLSKCLRLDPKERWTAKQLTKHPFLVEFNSDSKQIQEFNTISPTSILDQHIWSSIEESETLGDLARTAHLSFPPGQRIRRLSLNSGVPNWTWEETWTTTRENKDEKADGESKAARGSVTAMIGDDMELENRCGTVSGEVLILNFLGENISCRNSFSKTLMACTCTEHSRIVLSTSICFDRHKDMLLFDQSQIF